MYKNIHRICLFQKFILYIIRRFSKGIQCFKIFNEIRHKRLPSSIFKSRRSKFLTCFGLQSKSVINYRIGLQYALGLKSYPYFIKIEIHFILLNAVNNITFSIVSILKLIRNHLQIRLSLSLA